jgi:DNA-binding response OmpR family regulator
MRGTCDDPQDHGQPISGQAMKVLLVEDDLDQLDITAHMLRRENFAVVEASDGAQAFRRFKTERPDLVVLDLGLPAPHGLELLRAIRGEDQTPVLAVSGPTDRQEALRCFEFGADDCIIRPFEFRELTFRIRAILRRSHGPLQEKNEQQLEVGGLRLDSEAHEVQRGLSVTRLTPTEFRIFYTLVKNAGHVVHSGRLFANVWGNEGGAANSLRSHICHLRKKLGLDGGSGGSIASVPGVGYVFRCAPPPDAVANGGFGGHVAVGP